MEIEKILAGVNYKLIDNYKFRLSTDDYYVDKDAQSEYYKNHGANYSLYDFMPEFNLDVNKYLNEIKVNLHRMGLYVYNIKFKKGQRILVAIDTINHIEYEIVLRSELVKVEGQSTYNGSDDAHMIILSIIPCGIAVMCYSDCA